MNLPAVTIMLDREQARLLFELVQSDIQTCQQRMCKQPGLRETMRQRIIEGQAIRRQIPEAYWR